MHRKKNIIILYKTGADCDLIRKTLGNTFPEFSFYTVSRKDEYLKLLSSIDPSAVISDFLISGYSGLDALSDLRSIHPYATFLVVKSSFDKKTAIKCLTAGADDFIKKKDLENLPYALTKSILKNQKISANKKSLDRIKLRMERFRLLIENGFEFILNVNMDSVITYASSSSVKQLNFSRSELIGKSIFNIIYHEDRVSFERTIDKLRNGEHCEEVSDIRLIDKSGSIKWMEYTAKNLLNNDAVKAIVIYANDITLVRAAKQESDVMEKLYTTVFESLGEGLIIADKNGKVIEANPSVCNMLEYSCEEFIGLTPEKYIHPDELYNFSLLKISVDQGKAFNIEAKYVKKSGAYFAAEVRGSKILIAGAEKYVSILHDIAVQKEREQELQGSRERWLFALEGSEDGVWEMDIKNYGVYFSRRWKEMLGYNDDEIPNELIEWDRRIHPDDRRDVYKNIFFCFKNETPQFISQHRMLCKNGKYKWMLSRANAITRSTNGKPLRMIGTQTDISLSKENEDNLRKSEEKYRLLFETAHDAIFIMNGERFIDCNTKTLEMFNCNREEIIGAKPYQFSPPKQPDGSASRLTAIKKINAALNGEPQFFEWLHKRKDHSVFDAEVSLNKLYTAEGGMLQAIVRDITERKKAAEALVESEKKYREIAENAIDIIFTTDSSGNCTFANPAALDIIGYKFDEIKGKSYKNFIHPEHRKRVTRFYYKQYITKQNSSYIEYAAYSKDGKIKWLGQNSALIFVDGKVSGFHFVARDITDRIQAESASAAFANLGKRLSSSRSVKEAALIIADIADILLGWDACSFDLYSEEEDKIYTVLMIDSINGQRHDFSNESKIKPPSKAARKVLDEGAFLYSEKETSIAESLFNSFGDIKKTSAAILMVPIKHDNKNIGILSIHSYKTNAYTNSDLITLESLADHCAGAMERIRIEEELRIRERKFKDIFEYANIGIYQIDPEGNIITANKAFAQILGYKNRNELKQINLFKEVFFEELELKKMLFDLNETVKQGEYEFLWRTKSELVIWVQITTHAIKDLKGKVIYFEGFVNEITDKKVAEAKLLSSLKEKEILLQEIHHRVKNNLQVISSLLNLQARSIINTEVKELLRDSQNRVKTMALIHEKLYQSKNFMAINFAEYLKNLVDYLVRSYSINTKLITVVLKVDNVSFGIDTAIPCGLIINELVSNTLKHAFPEGRKGTVQISLLRRRKYYHLKVSDNGAGLPEGLNIYNTESLGLQLVNTLTAQLSGEMSSVNKNGTLFNVKFRGDL